MKNLSKIIAASILTLAFAGVAQAEVLSLHNWIPSGNDQGDLYTFSCPSGGSVSVTVDTTDDRGGAAPASIDPYLEIRDGDGNLIGSADDTIACTEIQACGYDCPQVTNLACGSGTTHSLVIGSASYGSAASGCFGGGTYRLQIEVKDAASASVEAKKVKLGGGPKVKLPAGAPFYVNPLINDGNVF